MSNYLCAIGIALMGLAIGLAMPLPAMMGLVFALTSLGCVCAAGCCALKGAFDHSRQGRS